MLSRFAVGAFIMLSLTACASTQIIVDGPVSADARAAAAGAWTGTWESTVAVGPREQRGSLQFTAATSGYVQGSMTNTVVDDGDGFLTGIIQPDGTFNGVFRFKGGTGRYPTRGVIRCGANDVRGALIVSALGAEMATVTFRGARAVAK